MELPFFSNRVLLKSVVGLMESADLDLQEKVFDCPFISVILASSFVLFVDDMRLT